MPLICQTSIMILISIFITVPKGFFIILGSTTSIVHWVVHIIA